MTVAIIKRFDVSEMWHPGWKRKIEEITEVVIHGTPGKTATGLLQWMIGGERGKSYKKGQALFHFLIDKNGTIYQIAPINRFYFHSCSGKHDKLTIGIELLNPIVGNEGDYSDLQYESLELLMFDALFTYCKNINRVVGHDYNYNTYKGIRKNCPGKNFDWKKTRTMFKNRNIDLTPELFDDLIEFEPLTWRK